MLVKKIDKQAVIFQTNNKVILCDVTFIFFFPVFGPHLGRFFLFCYELSNIRTTSDPEIGWDSDVVPGRVWDKLPDPGKGWVNDADPTIVLTCDVDLGRPLG